MINSHANCLCNFKLLTFGAGSYEEASNPISRDMMSRTALLKHIKADILRPPFVTRCQNWASGKPFHTSQSVKTDGVYHELTAMRVRTPWIEAFRKQQEESSTEDRSASPATAAKHENFPKRMSDSYHRIVRTDRTHSRHALNAS